MDRDDRRAVLGRDRLRALEPAGGDLGELRLGRHQRDDPLVPALEQVRDPDLAHDRLAEHERHHVLERLRADGQQAERPVLAQGRHARGRELVTRRDQADGPYAVTRAREPAHVAAVAEVHERRVAERLQRADAFADPLRHRRAERPWRQREQHDLGAPRAQRRGDGVGHVPEPLGRVEHALPRALGDPVVHAVEHVGDGRAGNTGGFGHVGTRHALAIPLPWTRRHACVQILGRQRLTEEQSSVSGREFRDRPNDLEAVPRVEGRGLEAVRLERDLVATAPAGFLLGRSQQPAPEPVPTRVLAHEQRLDPEGPTPIGSVQTARGSWIRNSSKSSTPVRSRLNALISSASWAAAARSDSLSTQATIRRRPGTRGAASAGGSSVLSAERGRDLSAGLSSWRVRAQRRPAVRTVNSSPKAHTTTITQPARRASGIARRLLAREAVDVEGHAHADGDPDGQQRDGEQREHSPTICPTAFGQETLPSTGAAGTVRP